MEEIQKIFSFQPSTVDSAQAQSQKSPAETKLGWNTCYIVSGMAIKDDKVLMIQEAKPSCRGHWYMPAGRVEQNESLEDAVKREVKEESGYEFTPKALIAIEFQTFGWVRFTFVGDITGGELKTPANEDRESIQAQWMPADTKKLKFSAQRLRAFDCLQLIELANQWHKQDEAERYSQLTLAAPHKCSVINAVVIRQDGNETFVLLKDAGGVPSFIASGSATPYSGVETMLRSSGYDGVYAVHGALSVEHRVQGGDGIAVTLLVSVDTPHLRQGCGYSWQLIADPAIAQKIGKFMKHEHSLINLIDLWR